MSLSVFNPSLCHLFPFQVVLCQCLTLSLPNSAKSTFGPNFQISFCESWENKWHHVKVEAESFHLNGHIVGLIFVHRLKSKSHLTNLHQALWQ